MQLDTTEAKVAASSRVLNTPELLEVILVNTGAEDLIRLRRTNITFIKTIEESPTIQKILFLKPNPTVAPRTWIYKRPAQSAIAVSPTQPPLIIVRETPLPADRILGCRYVLNPLLFRTNNPATTSTTSAGPRTKRTTSRRDLFSFDSVAMQWTSPVKFSISPELLLEYNLRDLDDSIGICSHMFITKPAILKATILVVVDELFCTHQIVEDSGVRFIHVLTEVRGYARIDDIHLVAVGGPIFVSEEQRIQIEGR